MQQTDRAQRVRVVRSFFVGRDVQEKDSIVSLPMPLAVAMRGANKVEFVDESIPLGKPKAVSVPSQRIVSAEKGA